MDDTVVDFTNDVQRYDVVFDAVGKSAFRQCKRLLKPQRVLFPIPKHDQAMVQYIGGLVESGAFTPVIDRRYPLDEIVEAYRYVETGQKIGNVVIRVIG